MSDTKDNECHGCKKPLSGRTLQALDHKWHTECWKCCDCQKPFFDGTSLSGFFHKGDTVVCGTCADIGVPCGGCGESLSFREAGGILKALSKFWHVKCFTCTNCKKTITKLKVSKSQKPYCEQCTIPEGELSTPGSPSVADAEAPPIPPPDPEQDIVPLSERNPAPATTPIPTAVNPASSTQAGSPDDGKKRSDCWNCKKIIDGRIVTALGHSFHPSCFVCIECKTPFGGKSFFTKNGNPLCHECNLKAAPDCGGCGKKISGRWLTAFDKKWHHECFVCTECRKQFEGGKFKLLQSRPGFPYCADCADRLINSE